MRDRKREITEWAHGVDWLHVQAVVCLGYTQTKPWEILRKFRGDLVMVVFEPSRAVAEAATPPEGVYVVSDIVSLRHVVGTKIRGFWRAEVMGDPSLHSDWSERIRVAVDEGARYAKSIEVTVRANAMPWTELGFAMLEQTVDRVPIAGLGKVFAGRPGVVVGAGPSLTDALPALKRLEGRAVICATSSALGALHDGGVQPDIVTTVEANGATFGLTVGMPLWQRAVLAPGSHCARVVYDAPAAEVYPAIQAVGSVGSWLCNTVGLAGIPTGGSVSTLAYSILHFLGCDPIILIGCDCSVRGDGSEVYAKGVRREAGEQLPAMIHAQAPAWGGLGVVPTTWALDSYRHWFETIALTEGHPGLINASKGGARIGGWAEVEPDRVADRFCAEVEKADHLEMMRDAAKSATPIDRAAIVGALRDQAEKHVEAARVAAEAEAAVHVLYEKTCDFIASTNEAPILAAAATAPLHAVAQFPSGNQLQALGFSYHHLQECATKVDEWMTAAIAALEDSHA